MTILELLNNMEKKGLAEEYATARLQGRLSGN